MRLTAFHRVPKANADASTASRRYGLGHLSPERRGARVVEWSTLLMC